ncbi:hypothetical protein AGMMS50212_06050 [Spirochaetia bacterium]|nr:hypothetical protein AGMMS50212_06050 [Spirochaetia bacterium]
MKKILTAAAFLLLLSGFCFAGAGREKSEIGPSFTASWTTEKGDDGNEYKIFMPAMGFQVGVASYFNDFIGLKNSMNVFFPWEMTVESGADSYKFKGSDFSRLVGFDDTFGVVISLINTGFFELPLFLGAHFSFLFLKYNGISESTVLIGATGNLAAEFHFTDSVYLSIGSGITADFVSISDVTVGRTKTYGDPNYSTFVLGINPSICIGIQSP